MEQHGNLLVSPQHKVLQDQLGQLVQQAHKAPQAQAALQR
jgi:hypothetical protein